jgi:hypothetical protein
MIVELCSTKGSDLHLMGPRRWLHSFAILSLDFRDKRVFFFTGLSVAGFFNRLFARCQKIGWMVAEITIKLTHFTKCSVTSISAESLPSETMLNIHSGFQNAFLLFIFRDFDAFVFQSPHFQWSILDFSTIVVFLPNWFLRRCHQSDIKLNIFSISPLPFNCSFN